MVNVIESSKTCSPAEDRLISLFCDVFGPKNSKYIIYFKNCIRRVFIQSRKIKN